MATRGTLAYKIEPTGTGLSSCVVVTGGNVADGDATVDVCWSIDMPIRARCRAPDGGYGPMAGSRRVRRAALTFGSRVDVARVTGLIGPRSMTVDIFMKCLRQPPSPRFALELKLTGIQPGPSYPSRDNLLGGRATIGRRF